MSRSNGAAQAPPALVIGFSIHGLAVARALARRGVQVHCLADANDPTHPTVFTRYATVHFAPGLNSIPLGRVLVGLATQISSAAKIVLFPTSDRIARTLAADWSQLSDYCLLSWAHCRELVTELQRKDALPKYLDRAGVSYPRSRVVRDAGELRSATEGLTFPLAIKPAQPLSSFKAIRARTLADLERCVTEYAGDLPFVIQEWIEGPEPSLYACTSFVSHGEPLFAFTSRKLAASPAGVGQGTVFETIDCAPARDAALQFIRGLDLSGPVALEFKRDATGKLWLIEPNVGRTEYCVDLAIQSGFNLPYIEYLYATGRASEISFTDRPQPCAWFDTDKDPWCYIVNRAALWAGSTGRRRIVFPYLGHDDWRPFVEATRQRLLTLLLAPFNRLSRLTRRLRAAAF